MRKHIFLFFLALTFLVACSDDAPKGIIGRDKMVKLMIDVHIIDGVLYNLNESTADTLYKYGSDKYNKLFKSYQTDSAQFKKSLKYYIQRPEIVSKMYADIMTTLQAKEDSLIKKQKEENKQSKKTSKRPNDLPQ